MLSVKEVERVADLASRYALGGAAVTHVAEHHARPGVLVVSYIKTIPGGKAQEKMEVLASTVARWMDLDDAQQKANPVANAIRALRLPVMQLAATLGLTQGELRRLSSLPRKDLRGDPGVAAVLGAVNRHLAALQTVRDELGALQAKEVTDERS